MADERRKREDKMTEKIASETTGQYRRHNAQDAQADKELARKTARASSRVVASAQKARKDRNERPLENEKDDNIPVKTGIASIGKSKRKPRGGVIT